MNWLVEPIPQNSGLSSFHFCIIHCSKIKYSCGQVCDLYGGYGGMMGPPLAF